MLLEEYGEESEMKVAITMVEYIVYYKMLRKGENSLKSKKLRNLECILRRIENWKFIANKWFDLHSLFFDYDLQSNSRVFKLFLALRYSLLQVKAFDFYGKIHY